MQVKSPVKINHLFTNASIKYLYLIVIFVISSSSTYGYDYNSCTKDGGDSHCITPKLTNWSYSLCNPARPHLSDVAASCIAMGGSYSNSICKGAKPITDDNYLDVAKKYADIKMNDDEAGSLISSWGITVTDPAGVCGTLQSLYNGGYLVKEGQKLEFFYKNSDQPYRFYVHRQKKFVCPKGYRAINDKSGNKVCLGYNIKKFTQCQTTTDSTPKETVGNPCSVTTGNKTINETDWSSPNTPLKISRFYSSFNSNWQFNTDAGLETGSIESLTKVDENKNYSIVKNFVLNPQSPSLLNSIILLTRPDNTRIIAQKSFTDRSVNQTEWYIDRDLNLQLSGGGNTWQVKNVKTGVIETYQTVVTSNFLTESYQFKPVRIDYPNGQFVSLDYQNGNLATATDNLGNQLTYLYDQAGKLVQIGLPNGKVIDYGYDSLGRLVTVKRPGFGIKTYVYDEVDKAPNDNPNLITGIIDENGKRYANYSYDINDRGILTEHAGGAQRYTLSFISTALTEVYDAYGTRNLYNIVNIAGTPRIKQKIVNNQGILLSYDISGNVISKNKSGIKTTYSYDLSRNLRTSTINAYGTPESTITLTEWHPSLPVKTKVTEGMANTDGTLNQTLRETIYTHDERGNVLTRTVTDVQTVESRTWKYTYNKYSQKLSETNPQGLTQYWDYTDKGYLKQYTDPQGLITTYSEHNSDGKPQTITSPTGQATTLTYDDAGRVLSQTTKITNPSLESLAQEKDGWINFLNWWRKGFNMPLLPNPVKYDIEQHSEQTASTTYEYDQVGQLIRTTLPDGQIINYTYDDAHRLIGMTDSLGNRIAYTLNGAGDITQTDSYDPQGTLANSSKQVFDNLGRLDKQQGNNGQYQGNSYDNQDNLVQSTNALGQRTQSRYDALKRKTQDIDPKNGKINYQYDGLGNLTSVKDAKGNTTTYTYNAFGELLEVNSPDTGKTTYTYNDKGQLTQQTDAAGRVQNHQYDGKGRLIKSTDQNNQLINGYQYDNSGRINKLTTSDTTINYTLNSNNQIIEKVQTVNGQTQKIITRYSYTNGGQNKEIRLNSGKLINYQYNDKGTLTGILIKHNDSTQLIDNLQYNPNGIRSYTWSQTNQPVNHTYDLDGRLTAIKDNALNRTLNYDKGNRITDIFDNTSNISFNYQHDSLDRLLKQTLKQAETTNNMSYQYDTNSNRTAKTKNGVSTNTPVKPENNQLENVTYDASGRTLNDGTHQYEYDTAGRIKQITDGSQGGHYFYNALGQRVQKNSNGKTTYYNYDESGQLIGEYDKDGKAIREYVYLGNMPIAMMSSERDGEILQVHTDHLGTPRAVSDKDKNILWRMEGDQFGDVQPQVEKITMPLRHAGQYYDSESGLFYNYFRYYDPKSGRYLRSDPIGLRGGLNTYNYVYGSPLHGVDPDGRFVIALPFLPTIGVGISSATVTAVGAITTAFVVANEIGQDSAKEKDDDCNNNQCPPCTPYPKYTIGYQGPKKSVRGADGTRAGTGDEHYIIFEVHQNPNDCKCRWQETKKLFGHHYKGQPQIGWINLNGRKRPPPYP